MAEDERRQPDDQKSLELPSLRSALGLGRKRRHHDRADDAPVETSATEASAPETSAPETSPVEPRDPVQPIPPVDPAPPIQPQEPAPPVPPGEPNHPERRSVAVLPAPTEESPAPPRRRVQRPHLPRLPRLPGAVVAMLTGAVVGLGLVGLTSAGLRMCSAVRGTPTCGNPGILVLLAITVGLVFLGSLLLHQLGVDTHGSTSFLGMGLLIVVVLLALLPVIDARWMVIAVPAISMACFLAAWWLTTTYVEPGDRPR